MNKHQSTLIKVYGDKVIEWNECTLTYIHHWITEMCKLVPYLHSKAQNYVKMLQKMNTFLPPSMHSCRRPGTLGIPVSRTSRKSPCRQSRLAECITLVGVPSLPCLATMPLSNCWSPCFLFSLLSFPSTCTGHYGVHRQPVMVLGKGPSLLGKKRRAVSKIFWTIAWHIAVFSM